MCEAATGVDALAAVRSERPGVVVLEVCLAELSGYEVCRKLRAEFGETVAIMFVSRVRTESYDRVAGLLVGADDYLAAPYAPDEFLARVAALARRSSFSATRNGSTLTEREWAVLRLLAVGLKHGEIAAELVISPKTVSTHSEHIFTKLGVHSRARAIAEAYRTGLLDSA